jgi:hypothetical protein
MKACLVRSKRGDLVLYSKLFPFEVVDSHIVASRVFQLGVDRRVEALVTLTQLFDACFQAHERLLLFRGGPALFLKGISALLNPTPTASGRAASATISGRKWETDAVR